VSRLYGYRALGVSVALLVLGTARQPVQAQELEPRTYSPSPIGTNFAVFGVIYQQGNVLTDPTLPVTDIEASGTTATLGYVRTLGLLGQSASLGLIVPYVWLDASGNVGEQRREVSRVGLGDPRLRLAIGLAGAPALTPAEFAQREPGPMAGASLTVVPPLGEYDGSRLVNLGSNRWAFKPEIGASMPWGNAFAEAAAGVWLFTDNDDFFGGLTREQDPLWSFQLHVGYTFRPGLWMAVDATYFTGGQTTLDGTRKRDLQSNARYGLTVSYPLTADMSIKLAWSTGLTTRVGGDFDTYGAFLQYRWFDAPARPGGAPANAP
jgi:hypothetical protein